MTSTQTIANHASFNSKQKSLHLPEQKEHQYSTTKQMGELETLSRFVSQHNLRTSTLTRKSPHSYEQSNQGTQNLSAVPTSENSRKSDTSPQASSENGNQAKGRLLPNRSSARQEKMNEETSHEKSSQRYETSRTRKSSEDIITYNTRRSSKAPEQAMETEDIKPQNENKKSVGEILTNQQAGGYHLRSTGHKSGNRDTSFSDYFEYEYPGRNPSGNEASSNYSSNIRGKSNRGAVSTNDDHSSHHNGESTSQKGGSGSKSGTSKRIKPQSIQSIMCNEEISTFEFTTEMHEKKRGSERLNREIREMEENNLKCTEELEDVRSEMRIEETFDLVEVTRSPPGSRNDNSRRRGKKCLNKLCLTNPNNPLLWAKEKVKGSHICKPCFDAYSNEQFCFFCNQIYLDDDKTTASDDKDWIGCDACGVWNHIQCEEMYGTKGLSVLSSRNKNYKYYCPRCRSNKSKNKPTLDFLEAPTTTSRGNTSPKQSHPTTPRRSQVGKNGNTRPALDDWLACEEGLEEPGFTKIRVNNDRKGNTVEVSVSGETDKGDEEEEDLIKKKLDALFSRSSGRRRIQQWKPVVSFEIFTELDKLMTQYGGKKLQLNEQEIKSDLNKIKEFSKGLNGLQLNSEQSGSEMGGMDIDMSEASGLESETGQLRINGRNKSQKKPPSRGKERTVISKSTQSIQITRRGIIKLDKIPKQSLEERNRSSKDNEKDSVSVTNNVQKMQLRTRKN